MLSVDESLNLAKLGDGLREPNCYGRRSKTKELGKKRGILTQLGFRQDQKLVLLSKETNIVIKNRVQIIIHIIAILNLQKYSWTYSCMLLKECHRAEIPLMFSWFYSNMQTDIVFIFKMNAIWIDLMVNMGFRTQRWMCWNWSGRFYWE